MATLKQIAQGLAIRWEKGLLESLPPRGPLPFCLEVKAGQTHPWVQERGRHLYFPQYTAGPIS